MSNLAAVPNHVRVHITPLMIAHQNRNRLRDLFNKANVITAAITPSLHKVLTYNLAMATATMVITKTVETSDNIVKSWENLSLVSDEWEEIFAEFDSYKE